MVLWPAIDVAVLWLVVAVVRSVESVLTSTSWAAAVQSDLVVLMVIHVFFSSLDPLHQVSSSRAFLARLVIPSELVLSHT